MVLITFLILCVFLMRGDRNNVAFIDMQRVMSQPATLLSKTKATHQKQQEILKVYASNLSEVIRDYGKSHKLTIISANVLSNYGGLDITDEIISLGLNKVKYHD